MLNREWVWNPRERRQVSLLCPLPCVTAAPKGTLRERERAQGWNLPQPEADPMQSSGHSIEGVRVLLWGRGSAAWHYSLMQFQGPLAKRKAAHLDLLKHRMILPKPSPWLCLRLPHTLAPSSPESGWMQPREVWAEMEELRWPARGGESSSTGHGAKLLRAPWKGEAESAPGSANLQPGLGIVQGLASWKFKASFH